MTDRLTSATVDEWTRGTLAERTAARLAEEIRDLPRWHPVESQRDLATRLDVSDATICRAKRLLAHHGVIAKHDGMYYVA